MIKNKRKLKPKNSNRSLNKRTVRPKATPELIYDMAKRYRESYVGETPEDIYTRRNSVHEEMSKYSNPLDIYDTLRTYEDTYGVQSDPESGMILTPFKDIFPGYKPEYDTAGNIYEYVPIPDYMNVPEGYTPIIKGVNDSTNLVENSIAPDFSSTYVWYGPSGSIEDELTNDEEFEYIPKVDTQNFASLSIDDLEDMILPLEEFMLDISTPLNVSYDTELFNPVVPENIDYDDEYFPTTLNKSVYNPSISNAVNPDNLRILEYPWDLLYEYSIDKSYPFTLDSINYKLAAEKDPFNILSKLLRRRLISSRLKVNLPDSLKLNTMEQELYDGLGIYWDKDLGVWNFDTDYHLNETHAHDPKSLIAERYSRIYPRGPIKDFATGISRDILFSLGDGINDYNSIYHLYDRLLRFLKYPYLKI